MYADSEFCGLLLLLSLFGIIHLPYRFQTKSTIPFINTVIHSHLLVQQGSRLNCNKHTFPPRLSEFKLTVFVFVRLHVEES